ncbi:MAG: 3-hexulose-6-phosphate synthase [Pseudomonadota bacterium]
MNAPLLQVALDFLDLDRAMACAEAVAGEVDILEVGTPLLKSAGVEAIRRLKARFPRKLVFADTKTMDAGALEAALVFDAGADIFSLCSAASHLTIMAGMREAHARGKLALIDLIGVEDILEAALRLEGLRPDYVCFHMGIDQQEVEGRFSVKGLAMLQRRLALPLVVAGGITPADVPEMISLDPTVIVVGAYITANPDPVQAARQVRQALAAAAQRTEE